MWHWKKMLSNWPLAVNLFYYRNRHRLLSSLLIHRKEVKRNLVFFYLILALKLLIVFVVVVLVFSVSIFFHMKFIWRGLERWSKINGYVVILYVRDTMENYGNYDLIFFSMILQQITVIIPVQFL